MHGDGLRDRTPASGSARGLSRVPLVAGTDDELMRAVVQTYRTFAGTGPGRSAAYEWLAESVAGDAAVLRFIASLPPAKRQPNLLFAAARYLLGAPPSLAQLRELVSQARAVLAGAILARRTQTNEAARCATLLPALAQLPPATGPDRGRARVPGSPCCPPVLLRLRRVPAGRPGPADAPTLRCEPRGPVPLPAGVPAITWRAGLDLNPLDVTSDDDVRWLSCLVWPGEGDRQERLAAAVATARRDPPAVHRGDLLTDLPALAAQAPAGADPGHLPHRRAVLRRPASAPGSPARSAAWVRSGCPARHPGCCPGRPVPPQGGPAHPRAGPRWPPASPRRQPRSVAGMAALTAAIDGHRGRYQGRTLSGASVVTRESGPIRDRLIRVFVQVRVT